MQAGSRRTNQNKATPYYINNITEPYTCCEIFKADNCQNAHFTYIKIHAVFKFAQTLSAWN